MYRKPLLIAAAVLILGAFTFSIVGATILSAEPNRQLAPDITLAALGTAITYQGHLTQSGNPANGSFDFQFRVFDALTNGNQVGNTISQENVAVSAGNFTTKIDFGAGIFTGDTRYLQISVRDGTSTGAFTTLSPRQELTAAPYALFAANAAAADNAWALTGNAGTDPTVNFLGTIDAAPFELRVNNTRTLHIESKTDALFGTVPNIVGGYSGNSVMTTTIGAVIAGGGALQDDAQAGDAGNVVKGNFGVIGGGTTNLAALWSTVAGGKDNQASGLYATISGGLDNTASGDQSVVAGGQRNTAKGAHAFAAGFGASALKDGSFVWSDPSGAGGRQSECGGVNRG